MVAAEHLCAAGAHGKLPSGRQRRAAGLPAVSSDRSPQHPERPQRNPSQTLMVVVDASALVDALLINGAARERLAVESLQAPELIDAELLSVLRRLVAGRQAPDSSRDSELGETLRRMILDGIWSFTPAGRAHAQHHHGTGTNRDLCSDPSTLCAGSIRVVGGPLTTESVSRLRTQRLLPHPNRTSLPHSPRNSWGEFSGLHP
jgi:hypothetical protein